MVFPILISLLPLLPQLVTSQVEIIDFPIDVTTCRGREVRFSCFVQFTSGTPSGAMWLQNGYTDASTLPRHTLFDNSSSNSSLPAIVNNTLVITNVTSESTYSCEQDGMESDSASLTILDPPTGYVVLGVPSTGSGSPVSIRLALSYDNTDTFTSISLSWRDSTGSTMDSVMLDATADNYTIMGLTPSTNYIITVFAINQCGNGPENVVQVSTESGSMPYPTATKNTLHSTLMNNMPRPTSTNNTGDDDSGAAAVIQGNIMLMGLVGLVAQVVITIQ